ncbi:MAG: hypothetical protein OJF51_001289 [Nitrospira sp.]|jgi:hypothetical protein|nr:MAG: hypothetical protein OJF51_001289 [Nitrospira sp.]
MSAKAAPEATVAAPVVTRSFTPARALLLQRKCACGGGPAGGCEECTGKKWPLQRSAAGRSVSGVPPIVNRVLSSPGQSLDAGTRSFMESRFGHDFGGVRIHADSQAAESARAVNAHAYTVGQNVVFGAGTYQPDSFSGRQLIAHELAHTVQQRGLQRSGGDLSLGTTEDAHLEREADRVAFAALNDQRPSLPTRSGPVLSRQALQRQKCEQDGRQPVCGGGPQARWSLEDISTKEVENIALDEIIVGQGLPAAFPGEWLSQVWTPPNATKAGIERGRADGVKVSEKGTELNVEIVEIKSCSDDGGGCARASVEAQGYVSALQPLVPDIQKVSAVLKSDPTLASASGTLTKGQIQSFRNSGVDVENETPLNAWKFLSYLQNKRGKPVTTAFTRVVFALNADGGPGGTYKAGPEVLVDCKDKGVEGQKRRQLVLQTNGKGGVSYRCDNTPCGPKVAAPSPGAVTGATVPAPPPVETLTVRYGTSQADIETPAGWVQNIKAPGISLSENAASLIPGFLLEKLDHQRGGRIVIYGHFDDSKGKLPITLKARDQTAVVFVVDPATGDLKLRAEDKSKARAISIEYPLLSPGMITQFDSGPEGLEFTGWIKPSLPVLGRLDVGYKSGQLNLIKGLEEATLKKYSVLGMRVTKAQLQLQLSPDFKPSGVIELQLGSDANPLASAHLELSADSIGLIADGTLKVNIPKMQTAESDISYKGGGGRDEWKTEIHIKSEDINLGSSVAVSGGFDGFIEKGDIKFTGRINATFPGENTAELGLKKGGDGWVLFGGGTFHFPKLDPTTVSVQYFLAKDTLVATGKTGFKIPAIGLGGRLDEVTFTIVKNQPVKVYGKGGLDFKKGKAEGHADVELHPSGKFTGKGSLSYKIKENIIVTGTVELNEKEKLRVTGELLITRYEIFKQYGDKKDLFTLDVPVPIPGLSIGTTGLVFHIRGGVGAAYSFGPGALEPLKFSAGFDPLEEDPDLELTVTGSVKVPASATLSAWISGSLSVQVDILVGSAGAEGGLELRGDLILSAGAFANFDAAYKKKRLTAKLVAGIDTKLLLGLSLTAFARAWAGAFGISGELRKDWTLAKKTIDTRVGFFISAPFEYADDTGVKLPEFKDVTLKKPEITTDNLKRILGELFGSASEKEVQA